MFLIDRSAIDIFGTHMKNSLHFFALSCLLLITVSARAQRIDAVTGRIGLSIDGHRNELDNPYSRENNVLNVGLNAALLATTKSYRVERLSFSYGLGYSSLQTTINPMMRLHETGIQHTPEQDSFLVRSVENWDHVVRVPLEVKFRVLSNQTGTLFNWPEVHVVLGLQSTFAVQNKSVDATVYSQFDDKTGQFQLYDGSPDFDSRVSDYYRPRFRNFSQSAYAGIELRRTLWDEHLEWSFGAHFYVPLLAVYKAPAYDRLGGNVFFGLTYVIN